MRYDIEIGRKLFDAMFYNTLESEVFSDQGTKHIRQQGGVQ